MTLSCEPSYNWSPSCLFLSLQSEFWCVLRVIIPPAVKFALLSPSFMLKMNAAEILRGLWPTVYSQNIMSEGNVR
jgi:hypothetical protein